MLNNFADLLVRPDVFRRDRPGCVQGVEGVLWATGMVVGAGEVDVEVGSTFAGQSRRRLPSSGSTQSRADVAEFDSQ